MYLNSLRGERKKEGKRKNALNDHELLTALEKIQHSKGSASDSSLRSQEMGGNLGAPVEYDLVLVVAIKDPVGLFSLFDSRV